MVRHSFSSPCESADRVLTSAMGCYCRKGFPSLQLEGLLEVEGGLLVAFHLGEYLISLEAVQLEGGLSPIDSGSTLTSCFGFGVVGSV